MYSTCLFCHGSLGANRVVEHFPVGRRLAFDAARGRLWAVCPRCGRWNLSPLEERWEAIEEAEREFRAARLRVQTEEIGLAQLGEGLQLIRVGRPQAPEFAAWRYGDVLGARRRAMLRKLAGGGLAAGTGAAAGAAAIALTGPIALLPVVVWGNLTVISLLFRRDHGRAVRVPGPEGRPLSVVRANLEETTLLPAEAGEGWRLSLRHATGFVTLEGAAARRALGALLPRVNELGATPERVGSALERIVSSGGPEPFLAALARESERRAGDWWELRDLYRRDPLAPFRKGAWMRQRTSAGLPINQGALPRLPGDRRLALEMALNEEGERRALEGELAQLEAAWREAETIAAISDRLLLPAAVEARLRRMRREPPAP